MNITIDSKYVLGLLMLGKYPKVIAEIMQCDESNIMQLARNMSSKEKDNFIRNGYLSGEKYQVMADVLGISKPGVFVRVHRKLHLTEMDKAVRKHSKDLKLKRIKSKRSYRECKNCGTEITNYNKNAIYCHTCSNKCRQNDYYHNNKEKYMEIQRIYQSKKKMKMLSEAF